MSEKIGIIGGGGHSEEAESYTNKKVAFRAVDKDYMSDTFQIDIENPDEEQIQTNVHIAVGAPGLRKSLEKKWPGEKYETIISEHAIIDPTAQIGEGTLIAPRAVITTNVKLGKHVVMNVASSIQHGSEVGDFSTIGPGVHVGGNVTIGEGVFIGIGANISNNLRIANGVVVGAGATLLSDADIENGVYVGTPAKNISQNEHWLNEI